MKGLSKRRNIRMNQMTYASKYYCYRISINEQISLTVMSTRQGNRVLFAPECPEPYFEDFGHGRLSNGYAHIELDPLFLDCIKTDASIR